MTAKQLYEAMLIEMNKVEAPSLILEDFNYFANKAIYQYIQLRYNIYDANQQSTDDLRVLKATTILPVTKSTDYGTGPSGVPTGLMGATYKTTLPSDYLHILNCICFFNVKEQFKCWDEGDVWVCGANRLTSDMYSHIINNFYMRPSYRRPYYFINNVNTSTVVPTNPYVADADTDGNVISLGKGTDGNLARSIKIGSANQSLIEKNAPHRYGNASSVVMEIRYGKDNRVFELTEVQLDYLKTPQLIRLTQTQLDSTADTSQVLEYPDYVCQEIINELTKLIMENSSDPRLPSNYQVNQTVAPPAQLQQDTNKRN